MAAILAVRPSVGSHLTAAWLWGLLRKRPGTIHVSAPTVRRARRQIAVHFADLSAQDRTVLDKIPVTALPRTLLDLAGMSSVSQLERAIARSEELGHFDLRPVEELMERAGNHPGRGKLRRALAIYQPEAAFERSKLEGRFSTLVREAGLPAPAMNFNLAGLELDAFWEKERFVVELDVYETHGTHQAFEVDRRRQDDLLLIGIEMIRVTGPRLKREPRATIERVARHLERRRHELR